MTKEKLQIKKWQAIGHEKVITALQNNIENNLVSHAYLFVGPESVGKSVVAGSFAKTLLCENSAKPCYGCDACKKIDEGSFSDYNFINKDKGKIKIEQVRLLQHNLSLKSYGNKKVCIIDGVNYFTVEAANAILKLLEEPKGSTVFILIASSLENIIPTIISRCTVYRFSLVAQKEISKWLESLTNNSGMIESITRMSSGRPGLAYRMINDQEILEEKQTTESDIEKIIVSKLYNAFANIGEWVHHEDCKLDKLDILLQWMRDLYLFKIGSRDKLVTPENIEKYYQKYSKLFSLNRLNKIISDIIKAKELIKQNVNRKLVLENIALSIKR